MSIKSEQLAKIRLIATDMDGTLTKQGKFTTKLLEALESLQKVGIPVLIITGRSAGWVDAIRSYLPIVGAVAENGGLFYFHTKENSELLTAIGNVALHRQKLAVTFGELKHKYPQIQESTDNAFRLTDWTFDVRELSTNQLREIAHFCSQKGWGFTYSNVQCHIQPWEQNKARSLIQVLNKYFPNITREEILTVGDSPNDESLFDGREFPLSVGVANITQYIHLLKHQPKYITKTEEAQGFVELIQLLLESL